MIRQFSRKGNGAGAVSGIRSVLFALMIISSVTLLSFSADAQQSLRMIGPEDVGGAWGEVIRRFRSRHPGSVNDYISGPWSTDARQNMYIRSFLTADAVELVYMDVIWTAKFAAQGWLLPLDDGFPPEAQAEFLPGDIEAGDWERHAESAFVSVRSGEGASGESWVGRPES